VALPMLLLSGGAACFGAPDCFDSVGVIVAVYWATEQIGKNKTLKKSTFDNILVKNSESNIKV
jgi:hypothetical protein